MGLPDVRKPDGTEAGLLGGILRVGFDLYANVRPIRLFPNAATPLSGYEPDGIDYVIVRENTEGLYLSRGIGLVTPHAATDTLLLTAHGCERIARFAFQTALKKQRGAPEDGRKRVTLVDKSNVLRSFAFFRRIFLDVAQEFPEVAAECLYVDSAAAALVGRPQHFQVIVTENLFGDILSDLGGATIGGLGMCPSANIGEHRVLLRAHPRLGAGYRRSQPCQPRLPDHVGGDDAGLSRRVNRRRPAGGRPMEGLRAAPDSVQDRRRGGGRSRRRRPLTETVAERAVRGQGHACRLNGRSLTCVVSVLKQPYRYSGRSWTASFGTPHIPSFRTPHALSFRYAPHSVIPARPTLRHSGNL